MMFTFNSILQIDFSRLDRGLIVIARMLSEIDFKFIDEVINIFMIHDYF